MTQLDPSHLHPKEMQLMHEMLYMFGQPVKTPSHFPAWPQVSWYYDYIHYIYISRGTS